MKNLEWIGSSKKDLMEFPLEVRQEMGYALHLSQKGEQYSKAKPLKHDTNAYRSIYIVSLGDTVYVIHSFLKKSKKGIKTPKEEIDIIKKRLKLLKKELEREKPNG